ncbi:hypothetical protein [Micromonospora sp. AKA38]|uniref:hypothetical protein n=1 Tax=Micromonospora sp. AKA38 TaxID=2733861 RepID=UPI0022BE8787|nr:hypothetical protein [Micromonospora sp. AKA38]GHJ12722.1 hypothetical protein TPA0908_07170 [Micromonospora sp. AKA38]
MLAELITVAQDGTSLEDLTHIAVLLTQWRNTAEVHADPVLLDHVGRAPSGDFGPASPHLG